MGAVEVRFDNEKWEKEAKPEFRAFLMGFGIEGLQFLKRFLTGGVSLIQKWFDPLVIIEGTFGGMIDRSNLLDNFVNKWGETGKQKLIELIDELLAEFQQ